MLTTLLLLLSLCSAILWTMMVEAGNSGTYYDQTPKYKLRWSSSKMGNGNGGGNSNNNNSLPPLAEQLQVDFMDKSLKARDLDDINYLCWLRFYTYVPKSIGPVAFYACENRFWDNRRKQCNEGKFKTYRRKEEKLLVIEQQFNLNGYQFFVLRFDFPDGHLTHGRFETKFVVLQEAKKGNNDNTTPAAMKQIFDIVIDNNSETASMHICPVVDGGTSFGGGLFNFFKNSGMEGSSGTKGKAAISESYTNHGKQLVIGSHQMFNPMQLGFPNEFIRDQTVHDRHNRYELVKRQLPRGMVKWGHLGCDDAYIAEHLEVEYFVEENGQNKWLNFYTMFGEDDTYVFNIYEIKKNVGQFNLQESKGINTKYYSIKFDLSDGSQEKYELKFAIARKIAASDIYQREEFDIVVEDSDNAAIIHIDHTYADVKEKIKFTKTWRSKEPASNRYGMAPENLIISFELDFFDPGNYFNFYMAFNNEPNKKRQYDKYGNEKNAMVRTTIYESNNSDSRAVIASNAAVNGQTYEFSPTSTTGVQRYNLRNNEAIKKVFVTSELPDWRRQTLEVTINNSNGINIVQVTNEKVSMVESDYVKARATSQKWAGDGGRGSSSSSSKRIL